MYINNPGHMTNMATMPIYDKNSSKISVVQFSRKLGMWHEGIEYNNVLVNHDPLICFMARSTWVSYTFELRKLLGKKLPEIGKWTEY